jgi:hypothetical protein
LRGKDNVFSVIALLYFNSNVFSKEVTKTVQAKITEMDFFFGKLPYSAQKSKSAYERIKPHTVFCFDL